MSTTKSETTPGTKIDAPKIDISKDMSDVLQQAHHDNQTSQKAELTAIEAAEKHANRKVKIKSYGDTGILTDADILKAVKADELMIDGFDESNLQPVGYECHLHDFMGTPIRAEYAVVDVHMLQGDQFKIAKLPQRMEKNTACLFSLKETFQLPQNIYAEFVPKSTWVRVGMVMNTALVDPGYAGAFTFTIVSTIHTFKFYPGDAIGVMKFYRLKDPPKKPYSGKYQNTKYLQQAKFLK